VGSLEEPKESFGTSFKKGCKAAGVFNRSAHGCRKIGATRAAENGASVAQLNAIFGWSGSATASLYTQTADRKRLAQEAMAKVAPSFLENWCGREDSNLHTFRC